MEAETQPANGDYTSDDPVLAVGRRACVLSHRFQDSRAANLARRPPRRRETGRLFLADSSKAVLTAQTLRLPPFTVVLEPTSSNAYAGMTVMLAGGTLYTQYVLYRRRAR